jgi:transposase
VQKRYLIHVAGYNLGLIMRLLTGEGTPRELAARASAWLGAILTPDGGLTAILLVAVDDLTAVLVISIHADPLD